MAVIRDIEEAIREIAELSGAEGKNPDGSDSNCRWQGILKSVLKINDSRARNVEIRSETSAGEKPVAFCELLYPFVSAGEEVLANKMESASMYRTAFEGTQNLLLEMLSLVSRSVFFYEFSGMNPVYKYKSAFDLMIEDSIDGEKTCISRDKYSSYIESMLSGEYIDFFIKYPVLARLMATATVLWLDFIEGFCSALERDWHEIARVFFNNQSINVSSISVSYEEATNFGNFIAVIAFENNKLIYKPRNINTEKSFHSLVQWANRRTGSTQLKAVKVLSRENYGWAEFVGHFQCETEEQVKNFYKRSGMLLGILYVFGSIDMHNQNLIASGEYPVLTDLEGLAGTNNDWNIASTLLLPTAFINKNSQYVSYNALAAETVTEKYNKDIIWSNINTDSMRMEYGYLPDTPKSLVRLNGKRVFSYNYTDQILEGFADTYFFIMNNSGDFLAKIKQLFKKDKVRYFFRNEVVYISALYNSLQPSNLKSVNKTPLLEKLTGSLAVSDQSIKRRIAGYEYESLSKLFIPRFYISLFDGRFEGIEGVSVTDLSRCIPYDRIVKKVKSLGHDDFQKQREIIQNAFSTYRSYYEQ